MWCVLLRDWNMAELVLWKEEGANQEFCCGGDPQHERKNPTGGGGTSSAGTSPLKISIPPGRIRLPANPLLPKHPAPRKRKVEHKLPRAFCSYPLTL